MAANPQPQAAPTPKTSFRSRRSHQSLHHISLAPLTSTLPADDYEEWASRESDDPSGDYGYSRPSRTYLSSTSVPSTPPLISHHSRSVSHTPRSKTPTRVPLSDTNLESIASLKPLHHTGRQRAAPQAGIDNPIKRQDSEWLLRAGLALAASTREEKGQAWLVKRESSTSLVSDLNEEDANRRRRRRDGAIRPSKSGISTPMALSRRGSRSRLNSRRGSRGDLSMTTSDLAGRHTRNVSSISETIGPLPDFVDENIRAEMAYIAAQGMDRNRNEVLGRGNDEDSWNNRFEPSSSRRSSAPYISSSDSELDSEDEVDEFEMQKLTRERGFGLGTWVDRLVEWTLFSVEEETQNDPTPSRPQSDSEVGSDGLRVGRPVFGGQKTVENAPEKSTDLENEDVNDDQSAISDDDHPPVLEKPSANGGWADVGWLFRAVTKSAF
ncbi:hypothetical protein FQN54_009585 [Arachnomyces sp. PD_36]|nr:hypothetical protein FQN54_009585 [Arachnomyces sp. PD_36]